MSLGHHLQKENQTKDQCVEEPPEGKNIPVLYHSDTSSKQPWSRASELSFIWPRWVPGGMVLPHGYRARMLGLNDQQSVTGKKEPDP